MKIRHKKKLRLDEVIQEVWNDETVFDGKSKVFFVTDDSRAKIEIDSSGVVRPDQWIDEDDTFTLEVEEELTMDTKLDEVTEIYYDRMCNNIQTLVIQGMSIREILDENNVDIKTIAICRGEVILYSDRPGINRP